MPALLGLALVVAAHRAFLAPPIGDEETVAPAPAHHLSLDRHWRLAVANVRPPTFFANRQTHVFNWNANPLWKTPIEAPFWERPMDYLNWNLWGKVVFMWHWDNAYFGSVYMYPMARKGFEQHGFLAAVHFAMMCLHWPLVLLALLTALVVVGRAVRMRSTGGEVRPLIPALGIIYFTLALYFLSWLPRYTIPARPFAYILAAAAASWVLAEAGARYWSKRPGRMDRSLEHESG